MAGGPELPSGVGVISVGVGGNTPGRAGELLIVEPWGAIRMLAGDFMACGMTPWGGAIDCI